MNASSIQLVVFSDDWGRHPSSCQHLVRRLLRRHPAWWVNTIGTRSPRLSLEDLGKAWGRAKAWLLPKRDDKAPGGLPRPDNLTVVSPRMWPGFRTSWQRRFNAKQMTNAVHAALGPRRTGYRRIAITTIPITADLVGTLDVDDWVYYCVDDFTVWPGLDASVMRDMERELVAKVDRIVSVSDTLVEKMKAMGRESSLLTHGIDLEHWGGLGMGGSGGGEPGLKGPAWGGWGRLPAWWSGLEGPIALFWGVVDARLDVAFCEALAKSVGSFVLVGPQQSPPVGLLKLVAESGGKVRMPGPVGYDELPGLAAAADVLVMPYADLPVTRAMQPLKFKEYLATGRPAVVRALPSTVDWSDSADVVDSVAGLVEAVQLRARAGISGEQLAARRRRLLAETWDHKAELFEMTLLARKTPATKAGG